MRRATLEAVVEVSGRSHGAGAASRAGASCGGPRLRQEGSCQAQAPAPGVADALLTAAGFSHLGDTSVSGATAGCTACRHGDGRSRPRRRSGFPPPLAAPEQAGLSPLWLAPTPTHNSLGASAGGLPAPRAPRDWRGGCAAGRHPCCRSDGAPVRHIACDGAGTPVWTPRAPGFAPDRPVRS